MEADYEINRAFDCIDKTSFDAINSQRVAWEQRQAQTIAGERQRMAQSGWSAAGFADRIATSQPHVGQRSAGRPPSAMNTIALSCCWRSSVARPPYSPPQPRARRFM